MPILAAIFVITLRQRQQLARRWQILFPLYVGVAGVTRVSWIILFPPLLVLMAVPTRRAWAGALIQSIIWMAAIFLIVQCVGAPDNSNFRVLSRFSESFGYGLKSLIEYFLANIRRLFDLHKNPLDVLQTFQVVALTAAFCAAPWVLRRKNWQPQIEPYFHLYNLAMIVAASLALYIIGTMEDYRVIATRLLLSLLVLTARQRYLLPVVFIIATNLLPAILFIRVYKEYASPKFLSDVTSLAEFQDTIAQYVQYDPQAPSPWCNTLLHHVDDLTYDPYFLLGIPAGIGQSFFFEAAVLQLPPKSHYVMVSNGMYTELTARTPKPWLEELTKLPNERTLYRNADANCAPAEMR